MCGAVESRYLLVKKSVRLLVLLSGLAAISPAAAAEIDADEAFLNSVASNLDSVSRKIVAIAKAVPAESYSWSPTPDVRSVSEVLMHIVGGNFQLPADLGASPPKGIDLSDRSVWGYKQQRRTWEKELVDKEAVIEILSRSFDYAVQAIPTLEGLDEDVATWGFPDSKRYYLLLLLSHAHEHLGQSIAYARALGITPPWSQKPIQLREASTAVLREGVAQGEVVTVDRFGNLNTSFVASDLESLDLHPGDRVRIESCGSALEALLGNELFDVRPGEWISFLSSNGILIVGKSFASAAQELGCEAGASIKLGHVER